MAEWRQGKLQPSERFLCLAMTVIYTFSFKTFYSRRDEQRLESNVELTKQFPMTVQADRNGGLRVCGDAKTKSGPKLKQLVT